MPYYHVYIEHHDFKRGKTREAYELDLSIEELTGQIVNPYLNGETFMVGGQPIDAFLTDVIKISKTEESSSVLLPKLIAEERRKAAETRVYGIISDELLIIDYGVNVTREFIKRAPTKVAIVEKREAKEKTQHSNRVFVVHGKDEAMKQAVARTLEKLGLEPIILHEQPNEGRTVIEKFSNYSDVSFAVVLLSADDFGCSREEGISKGKFRARQNVILELGFFMGKLGRKNVLPLYREAENFEMSSDYAGVVYTPFDSNEQWKFKLVQELNACSFKVDANKLL